MIYHIATTTSTNDDARDARYRHGDIIWAEHQRAGRGQRGHSWTSSEGLNLTFSVVLEPTFLPVSKQFLLSEAVALALTDTFATFGICTRIKWTNDIYVGDRKLVGILIEHGRIGKTLERTVVGIGINVNQCVFDPALPNPISMCVAAGSEFDREQVLACFEQQLLRRFAQLAAGEEELLQRTYIDRMYRRGEQHPYRLPNGELFEAAIEGVEATGELILRHADGSRHNYLFREVEFVLNF